MENIIKEEHIKQNDWLYAHTYTVKQDGVHAYFKSDNTIVKSYIDLDQIFSNSLELESYLPFELLEKICKQPCVYEITKGEKRHYIWVHADTREITIRLGGWKKDFDIRTPLKEVYKKIQKEWHWCYGQYDGLPKPRFDKLTREPLKKLVVEESIKEIDCLDKYQYRVDEDNLRIILTSDTDEVKKIFNLARFDKQSNKLKDYIPKEVLEVIRKHKCDFYIYKDGLFVDIKYKSSGYKPHYLVNANGHEIYMKSDDDFTRTWKVMKKEWKLSRKEEE